MGIDHQKMKFFFLALMVNGTDQHTTGFNSHHGSGRQIRDGDAGLSDQLFWLIICEYIAKEILLLKQGVLLEKAAPQAMLHAMQGKVREVVTDREGMQALTCHIAGVAAEENGLLHLRVISEEPLGEPVRPTLEDVYLHHFGYDTV